jgi:hypothetical protein
VLEPHQALLRRGHRVEPRGGDFGVHSCVVTAQQQDQRYIDLTDRGEVELEKSRKQIGCGEVVAFPDTLNLFVAILGGEPDESSVGDPTVSRVDMRPTNLGLSAGVGTARFESNSP